MKGVWEDFQKLRDKTKAALRGELDKLPMGDYVLELGCGHGHFLTALAARHKETGVKRSYVGVDKKSERLQKGRQKSQRAGVEIFWTRGSVEDVLELWPQGRTIREVFVLFPDPWPKSKQLKHRFMNAELLESISTKVAAGGLFHFRSDAFDYCDDVRALLAANKAWRLDDEAKWPEGLPATVFEGHHPVFGSLIAVRG